jgi:SAM-dependent methyltransferase
MAMTPETPETPETDARKIVWRGLSAEPPPEHGPLDVPFDQYQRYRVTADLIGAAGSGANGVAATRVLDVGGHHSDFWGRVRRPIADFLPACWTVTLDVAPNPLRGYIRGRGDALPFRAGSFDVVCSVDVLEHVPPAARAHLANELHRVAKRGIILAAPFRDPLLARAEAFVSDFIRRTCGYEQGQLQEHRELGWPDLATTCKDLAKDGWHVRVFPYGSLWRWTLMMIDKHAVSAIAGSRALQSRLDRRYNETWFAHDRGAAPAYRHFIVAAKDEDDALLRGAETHFNAVRNPALLSPGPGEAEAERQFELLAIHAQNQTLQAELEPSRRDTHVAELEALRTELYKNLDALTTENTRLVAMLRDIERSTPYRALTALKRLLPSGR